MLDVVGRAPEILQAQLKQNPTPPAPEAPPVEQQPVQVPVAPPVAEQTPVTPPVTPMPIGETQPPVAPPVTPKPESGVYPLEAFPDEDIKALAASQGVSVSPFDRAAVLVALAAKGITHATK